MKIIMVMLATADGKSTRGRETNIYTWTSIEDQKYFFDLIKRSNLIVMGRSTYEAVSSIIKLEENKLRIVLTHHPKIFQSRQVPGQLEFSSEKPRSLARRLSKLGYKDLLLVGGSAVNGSFLKDDLVDEFYLTIEPKIFGLGKNIVDGQGVNVDMSLISSKKINAQGTVLLKYRIIRHSSSAEYPKDR